MTSDKKAEANRRNALKSTGPKTPAGKNLVRLNAVRHGLRAEEILIAGEDQDALEELGERLRAELQPVGELENLLVDRIVAGYWRLRRVGRVESGIFAWDRSEEMAERAEWEARSYEKKYYRRGMFNRDPEIEISDEKKHEEALSRAHRIRSEQNDETVTLGRTFARDADKANAFSNLSRYESSIERQIYRALHELERRQAARAGAAPPPPQIVDVDVSGIPEGAG